MIHPLRRLPGTIPGRRQGMNRGRFRRHDRTDCSPALSLPTLEFISAGRIVRGGADDQTAFGVNKAQTGVIISYSAAAYAIGKFIFGPVIEGWAGKFASWEFGGCHRVWRFGGVCHLAADAGGCYTMNRFCGSAGWGSIIKQTPRWFPARHISWPWPYFR